MSFIMVGNCWKHSNADGTKLLVLLAIADAANEEGEAYPSQMTIMKRARAGESTVKRHIKTLVEEGELVVLAVGRGRRSTRYRVIVGLENERVQSGPSPENERVQSGPSEGPPVDPQRVHGYGPQTVIEQSSNDGPTPQPPVDVVWAAYQVHHPQSKLTNERRALIERRLQDFSPATLIDAIDGNHRSPYHCGDNREGKTYHDLGLILRSADKIERFATVAESAPVTELAAKRNLSARDIGQLADHLEQQEGNGSNEAIRSSQDPGTAVRLLPPGRDAA